MDLYFERGSRETPKGHALVYFRQRYNQDEIMATYIITLPIKVDVSKYIPPMFAAQIQGMNSQELSGFAFPHSRRRSIAWPRSNAWPMQGTMISSTGAPATPTTPWTWCRR